MAYATGTVLGTQALLSAISSFMTGNGWTLHDNLSGWDKVFKSPGVDGKQNHIIRLTNEEKYLDYDAQSANFTVGDTITGGTSGASAVILADSDSGSTGTLSIVEVSGRFVDNETITGNASGSATVNGVMRFKTIKDPSAAENCLDWIVAQGYAHWNNTTHVGTNPHGRWGPYLFNSPQISFGGYIFNFDPVLVRTKSVSLPPFVYDIPKTTNLRETSAYANIPFSVIHSMLLWDGVRKVWGFPGSSSPWENRTINYDLALSAISTAAQAPQGSPGSMWGSGIHIWDRTNDRGYIYALQNTGDHLTVWKRLNLDTNLWEGLAATNSSLLPNGPGGARYAWDGEDSIYMGASNGPLNRFSISGNSWTQLAAPPDNFSFASTNGPNGGACHGVYVPRGTIPGVTEDIIYFLTHAGGTMSRYNVSSNTWSDHVNLPVNGAETKYISLTWDQNRYVYYSPNSPPDTYGWRLDLQNIGGGWTSFPLHPAAYNGREGGTRFVAPYIGKLKTKALSSMQYHIVGDADHVVVAVKVGTKWHWISFGLTPPYSNPNIMTTTASASPGVPATFTVDSTAGFQAGSKIVILDPSNGAILATTVHEITSATAFKAFSTASFTTGTRVFVDGINTVITGDSWLATYGHDAGGYEGDAAASSYRLAPLVSTDFSARAAPSARGRVQITPLYTFFNAKDLKNYENRGVVQGVYVLTGGVYPNPVQGDIVLDPVTSKQYILLAPHHQEWTSDSRLIAIGPIN